MQNFEKNYSRLFAIARCFMIGIVLHNIVVHEYSANFLYALWKRVRKNGAFCMGITRNVNDLMQSHTTSTMLANSEFNAMLCCFYVYGESFIGRSEIIVAERKPGRSSLKTSGTRNGVKSLRSSFRAASLSAVTLN